MTKRQTIASAKYNAKTYEEVKIRVKIGEKDRYKAAAAHLGVSVNQLFVNAVEEIIADRLVGVDLSTSRALPSSASPDTSESSEK